MIVAGVVTLLCHRFKQPVVLGYILAGLIIGPHTPPFPLVQERETIETLAELGIIFLMFSLGLEFNLRKVKQVGQSAALAAVLEISVMIAIGYGLGRGFGWGTMDSIFLGAMLAISSTTILIKALGELGLRKERFAELIFGILIIEDILAIIMIALLSGIAMTGSMDVAAVGTTIGRLAIFLVMVLVIGLIAVPRLLNHVGRYKSDEMLLVTVLGLCFGSSLLAVKMGYSVALGAFVIGAVIAEARDLARIERLTQPLRDMFSAVFFVAIGLLIDPALLRTYAWPIAIITVTFILGKVLACSLGMFLAGNRPRTALRVGMGLAQIGEFSFIIAALGLSLNVTSDFLYPIAVAVSVLTTLLTPYLIRGSDGLVSRLGRATPRPVGEALDLYTRWTAALKHAGKRHQGLAVVRSLVWQNLLNVALIAGVFVSAAFAARSSLVQTLPGLERLPGGARTAFWTLAVVVALPIYVATFRKLQALGMMLAEISIPATAGRHVTILRRVVENMFLALCVAGLGVITLLLSSTILPPRHLLLELLVVIGVAVFFFGTTFNRLYTRGKFALVETWTQPHSEPQGPALPLPALLRDAAMDSVVIVAGAVAGKRIRELALRAETGASIVAIERVGRTIVNPGPDEELQEGDQVLLLGDRQQLAMAAKVLRG